MTVYGDKNNFKVLWYLIPILIVGSIAGVISMNKITENVFKEYPFLKSNESLNTTIVGFDKYKGTTLVILDDSIKKSISAFNWDLTPSPLHYHLEKGDSISCKPFSNRLLLIKKDSIIIKFEVQYFEK